MYALVRMEGGIIESEGEVSLFRLFRDADSGTAEYPLR